MTFTHTYNQMIFEIDEDIKAVERKRDLYKSLEAKEAMSKLLMLLIGTKVVLDAGSEI